MTFGEFADQFLAATGVDGASASSLGGHEGEVPLWPSALPVGALALESLAVASLAMNLVSQARGGRTLESIRVSPARAASSFTSERLFRLNGSELAVWAPLSGFWQAADGWVRTHANYAHHEERLRSLVGVSSNADREAFGRAVGKRLKFELEADAAATGAIVAAVRTPQEWSALPHAAHLRTTPLMGFGPIAEAPPRKWHRQASRPLSGIRVLDLTRTIAGPVAARDLALAGAEVLRIDPPRIPESQFAHLDTGQGKRSTRLDLTHKSDRATFEELLTKADVIVTGYRPGSLDAFGLAPEDVAERHPGIISASVSAWGLGGPWSTRRGFDSIVQAAIGIAIVESPDGSTPGALPAQALDHASGHFLSAGIALSLLAQRDVGGSRCCNVALARVGQALLDAPGPVIAGERVSLLPPTTVTGYFVADSAEPTIVTCAAPALEFYDAPRTYDEIGRPWGNDEPVWRMTK